MSWCRWGSPCQNGLPPNPVNDECPMGTCPGSDLYIYEGSKLTCCACSLGDHDTDFEAEDELAMYRHILDHDAAGHHVRKSILKAAREACGVGVEARASTP